MPQSKMTSTTTVSIFSQSIAAVALVALLLCSIPSCKRNKLTEGFATPDKKTVSQKVELHRTSRQTVTITDTDGFGLVNGRVNSIAVRPNGKSIAIVEFTPFDDANASKRSLAKINLDDATTTALPDITPAEASLLEPIDDYFPQ